MGRIRKYGGALKRGDIFKTPRLREIVSKRGRTLIGSKNPFYGKHHSHSTLNSISSTIKNQYASGRKPWNKGKTMSAEQRRKISISMRR